jgi:hypothetical protein
LLLAAVLILAGCGGKSGAKPHVVAGDGFRFEAPAGWKVERAQQRITARHGSTFVQVSTFRLIKPYKPALFDAVAKELSTRMRQVAQQVGGNLEQHGVVAVGGVRAHAYRVTSNDRLDDYTFVLSGKLEYQLLCHRKRNAATGACRTLVRSFVLA